MYASFYPASTLTESDVSYPFYDPTDNSENLHPLLAGERFPVPTPGGSTFPNRFWIRQVLPISWGTRRRLLFSRELELT